MANLLNKLTQARISSSIIKQIVCRNYSLKPVNGQFLKPIVLNASFTRNIFAGEQTEHRFKIKDNVSDAYELIYINGFPNQILAAKIVSTAILTIVVGKMLYMDPTMANNINFVGPDFKIDYATLDKTLCLTALISLTCFLQLFSTKVPLRIYRHPKDRNYLLVGYETFFFKPKVKPFIAEDVKPAPTGAYTPFPEAKFLIQGEVKYLIPESFKRPSDFNHLMGYEKPRNDDDF